MVHPDNNHSGDVHEKRDIELRVLSAARAPDFTLDRVLGTGDNGVVVSAKCTRRGLPRTDKLYAVKILFNDSALRSREIRAHFTNEWEILSRIRTHPHVIRYWSQFVDLVPDVIAKKSKYPLPNLQSQFVILDYHGSSMGRVRASLPALLPVHTGMRYCRQLADGLAFLKAQGVLHLDLKPDNVLLSDVDEGDDIIICDFGCAQQFDNETMKLELARGETPGGNPAHLAPEVLNEWYRVQRGGVGPAVVSYSRQTEWSYGCMVHEIVKNCHPFPEYPVRYGRPIHYYDRNIPALPASYPQEFQFVVRQLLSYEPSSRPNIAEVLTVLTSCEHPDSSLNQLHDQIAQLTAQITVSDRERHDAKLEVIEAVRLLQTSRSETRAMLAEREEVALALTRSERDRELAVRCVAELRLDQERDKRDVVTLRRERDLAQTLVNQFNAALSHNNPSGEHVLSSYYVNRPGGSSNEVPSATHPPKPSSTQPGISLASTQHHTSLESGYVSARTDQTPLVRTSSRKKWSTARVPNMLAEKPGEKEEQPPPSVGLKRQYSVTLYACTVCDRNLEKDETCYCDTKSPGTIRNRMLGVSYVKCNQCGEHFGYKSHENHPGACRFHPGKLTEIDWGWQKVRSWECCGASSQLVEGGEWVEAPGCQFSKHVQSVFVSDDEMEKPPVTPSAVRLKKGKRTEKTFVKKKDEEKDTISVTTFVVEPEPKPKKASKTCAVM